MAALDRVHPETGHHGARRGARHVAGHGHLRRGARPELRQHDRGGHAARDPGEPRGQSPCTWGPTMLRVRNLRAGYGGVEVLHGVSLHVDGGEIVTIVGANGAGKSTLLNAVAGIVRPSGGAVKFRAADIARHAGGEPSRPRGCVLVPEGRQIFARPHRPGEPPPRRRTCGGAARETAESAQDDRRRSAGSFPSWRRDGASRPARSPAASSRCSPWAGH